MWLAGILWKEKSAVVMKIYKDWKTENKHYLTDNSAFAKKMESEFIIPLCKDDLLCAEEGSYVVDEIMSVRCLPRKITGEDHRFGLGFGYVLLWFYTVNSHQEPIFFLWICRSNWCAWYLRPFFHPWPVWCVF